MNENQIRKYLTNQTNPRAKHALQQLDTRKKLASFPGLKGAHHSDQQQFLLSQIQYLGLPTPTLEHAFHPVRKWRFDLAWPDLKIAVECEGIKRGEKSRHTTPEGYTGDTEKYNAAAELGWFVFRYVPKQIYDHSAILQIERVLRKGDL